MYMKYSTLVPYRKLPASFCLIQQTGMTRRRVLQQGLHTIVKKDGVCFILCARSTRRYLHLHACNLPQCQLLAPFSIGLHFHRPFSATDNCEKDGKPFSTLKSSPVQISPDIYTQNREEIISALAKSDFRKSAPRFVRKAEKDAAVPKSAVFLPLCLVNGEPSVLFTLRSAKLSSHRGQVSFPGGRIDPSDVDSTHTALREMEEELGIPSSYADVWGELTPVIGRNFSVIYVTLGFIGHIESLDIRRNPKEVESVFTMKLHQLCDPGNRHYTYFDRQHKYTSPVFLGGEHRVWGFSAIMLDQALRIILPTQYQAFENIGLHLTPSKWT